jgi:hypothetical protein
VVWGTLRGTSRGEWLGVPPGGGTFAVPFANLVPFSQGLMAGERIYFDLRHALRAGAASARGGPGRCRRAATNARDFFTVGPQHPNEPRGARSSAPAGS